MPDLVRNAFDHKPPPISPAMKDVLVQYSHIPEDSLETHVRTIRNNAYAVFPYPSIGLYGWLRFVGPTLPKYASAVERLKAGQTLLDLGTCMGQEIRKLVFDGAPAENVSGMDIDAGFWKYGHELFKDEGTFKSPRYIGDIFESGLGDVGGEGFDMIMAIYFFHLFDWDEQVEALSRVVGFLKRKPGSMIFGVQFGADHPRHMVHSSARTREEFGHDPESLRRQVDEVEKRVGLKLGVEAQLRDPVPFMNDGTFGDLGGPKDWRWLAFSVTIE